MILLLCNWFKHFYSYLMNYTKITLSNREMQPSSTQIGLPILVDTMLETVLRQLMIGNLMKLTWWYVSFSLPCNEYTVCIHSKNKIKKIVNIFQMVTTIVLELESHWKIFLLYYVCPHVLQNQRQQCLDYSLSKNYETLSTGKILVLCCI